MNDNFEKVSFSLLIDEVELLQKTLELVTSSNRFSGMLTDSELHELEEILHEIDIAIAQA